IMGITEDEYDNILEGFREEFKVYKNDIIYRRVFARKKMNE
ncbi:16624_t:CDS:1, partial [Acaulospora morrowiae]